MADAYDPNLWVKQMQDYYAGTYNPGAGMTITTGGIPGMPGTGVTTTAGGYSQYPTSGGTTPAATPTATSNGGQSAGQMSAEDQAAIDAYKAQWAAANAAGDQAAMDKAHADAELIRAQYGYGGGADGSGNYALSDYYSKYGAGMPNTGGTQVKYYDEGGIFHTDGYVVDGKTYDANGNLLNVGSIVLAPNGDYTNGSDWIVTYDGGMKYGDYQNRLAANTITPVTGISSVGGIKQGSQDPGFDWAAAKQTGLHAAGQPGFGQNNNYMVTPTADGGHTTTTIDPEIYKKMTGYYPTDAHNNATPAGTSITGTPTATGNMGTAASPTGAPTAGTPAANSYNTNGRFNTDRTAEYYIGGIYEAQTEAAKAALKAAYDQSVLAGNAARDAVPGTYFDAKNKTAAQAAIQRSNFNEYAAANGLNSGAGGQAQLSMGNALQSNLSNLDLQQAKDISAIDIQLAQLAAKYQSDIAAAIAEGQLGKAQALYQQYQIDQQNAIQQAQFNAQMALQQQQMAMSQQDSAMQNALQAASMTGIFGGMAAYGWTPEMIASAESQWKLQNTPKQTYTGGGGGGGSSGGGGGGEIPLDQPDPTDPTTPTDPKTPTEHSAAYASVGAQVETMHNQGAPVGLLVNILAQAMDNGLITPEEALEIGHAFGITTLG